MHPRRKLDREEQVAALHMFYVDGKNLSEVASELKCSLYDLSPWVTRLGHAIIMGVEKQNPELAMKANLVRELEAAARPGFPLGDLIRRAANALRVEALDNQVNQDLLYIADINYREALDLLERFSEADILVKYPGGEATNVDLMDLQDKVIKFLSDESPTDTEDRYTQAFAADGVVFMKDGVPLSIDECLDILNGRTRR